MSSGAIDTKPPQRYAEAVARLDSSAGSMSPNVCDPDFLRGGGLWERGFLQSTDTDVPVSQSSWAGLAIEPDRPEATGCDPTTER